MGVSEADGGLVGMCEIPESQCAFVLQDAEGELLMRRDYTEFSRNGLAASGLIVLSFTLG